MSTYKVIQDIEAEDHILGPLSLRQFLYALVAVFFFYLSFICIAKHFPYALVVLLPPGLFCAFFAFPFGKDQSTEVWALAKIRFLFKPRKRIWNQSGVKELVTITAPKKVEVQLTNGLSQNEVKSRLEALADTLDTRGWAVKTGGATMYSPQLVTVGGDSDRLVGVDMLPQQVPDYQIPQEADVLDDRTSPLAQQFAGMLDASNQAHRQKLVEQLQDDAREEHRRQGSTPQWFSSVSMTAAPQVVPAAPVAAQPTVDEATWVAALQARQAAHAQVNRHMHGIPVHPKAPVSEPAAATAAASDPVTTTDEEQLPIPVPDPVVPVTATPDPAILDLASNNDLNVATLARQAGRVKESRGADGEVVISLH